jgi:hypothetical protein
MATIGEIFTAICIVANSGFATSDTDRYQWPCCSGDQTEWGKILGLSLGTYRTAASDRDE